MSLQQDHNNRHSFSGLILRVCDQCGDDFKAVRPHAIYCSPACKQKAYRQRSNASLDRLDSVTVLASAHNIKYRKR
jgi:hypothetical protein